MQIPVVDLEDFPAERLKLQAACREQGCFRVINHGIPASLLAEMKAAVRSLFDLPDEAKRRNVDIILDSGYMPPSPQNPLYESLGLYDAASPADVDAFCAGLDAPPQVRETIKLYACRLHQLAVHLSRKIAAGLGLPDCAFDDWPCQFRLNKYHFSKETVGTSGVQIHTDSGFLTVLQEDDCVGGLEVLDCSTGTYVPVDPVPGTFVVNLGDVAKAWSNGRLHNVKHRVQCKEVTPRISIALFLLAPKDDKVEPPPALVDAEHPRLFPTFTYENYRRLRLSVGQRDGDAFHLLSADEEAQSLTLPLVTSQTNCLMPLMEDNEMAML